MRCNIYIYVLKVFVYMIRDCFCNLTPPSPILGFLGRRKLGRATLFSWWWSNLNFANLPARIFSIRARFIRVRRPCTGRRLFQLVNYFKQRYYFVTRERGGMWGVGGGEGGRVQQQQLLWCTYIAAFFVSFLGDIGGGRTRRRPALRQETLARDGWWWLVDGGDWLMLIG